MKMNNAQKFSRNLFYAYNKFQEKHGELSIEETQAIINAWQAWLDKERIMRVYNGT